MLTPSSPSALLNGPKMDVYPPGVSSSLFPREPPNFSPAHDLPCVRLAMLPPASVRTTFSVLSAGVLFDIWDTFVGRPLFLFFNSSDTKDVPLVLVWVTVVAAAEELP